MRSQEYLHAIKDLDPLIGVYQKACPDLVEIVEAGEADSPRAEEALRRDLADIVRIGADTLVLGCTHYPLLKPAITRVFPDAFQLVDSATTTAAKVERTLDHSRLRAGGSDPVHEVVVTAMPKHFHEISSNLFGETIEAEEVRIWEEQKAQRT
jgi:glutamate racemase